MKVIKVVLSIATIAVLASCNNQGVTKKSLENEVDSASYALGLDMGSKLRVNFAEANNDLFVQGFRNGVDSTELLIEMSEINGILQTFFQNMQQRAQAKQQEEAQKKAEVEFAEVKEEGIKFLEENKNAEGVKTTASGLQYIVLKEGSGEKPVSTSRVKVHYHGTLIDGTVFDSSVERDQPSEFAANAVIKGWTEGLQLMSVGSKYKFFIPQELGYGANPRPGKIKPFMTLIFEVELLEIMN
jgi:FKBP-type peptidyl-prolyl cis-trans isomerase